MNQNHRLDITFNEGETLIEQFKRYYADYRKTSDMNTSFISAYEALTLSVIDQVDDFADKSDVSAIRNVVREYREIRISIQGSNDSVKERFEREYQKHVEQNKVLS